MITMNPARSDGIGPSRRMLYRRSKRILLDLLACRWRGPRRTLEPAVRRCLRRRSRRELSRLLRDRRVALAMAAALLATAPAVAAPPVELSDVAAGIDGFVINGINATDFSGWSVSGAGDVNGDGLGDVIVGAPSAGPGAHTSDGESYVVFGKADSTAVELADVVGGIGGFVINGSDSGDTMGNSVSGAGDVNGDGLDDLLVGAYRADPGGATSAGESYVVFGKADTAAVALADVAAGAGGFLINGIDADDESGNSVSGAGDVNGDGLDDLLVGAWAADPGGSGSAGESYVIFGKADTMTVELADVAAGTGGFVINGIDADDRSGRSVSGAGDVNGDGRDDLILGAPYADPSGRNAAGESYVVFGKSGTAAVELAVVAAGGPAAGGFVINGIDAADRSGRSVSGAGDVNGDGLDDVLVGAIFADPGGIAQAGESYVVFGKADTAGVELADVAGGTGGFVINGIDANDNSGRSVSGAGDMNGDGLADVIVGAYVAAPGGTLTAGESYVVFGKADGTAVELADIAAGTGGFVINGIDADDRSGFSVSSAGDVNGDGQDDLVVGAPYADPLGNSIAGESYVVFGPYPPVELADVATGDGGFVINGIDTDDLSGYSVSGAGDINGDGLADVIVGAPRAAPGGDSLAGESYVVFGKVDGTAVELSSVAGGTGGFVIKGIDSDDSSGASVSGAGDVNDDGLDDVIVGAWAAKPGGDFRAGESYVVFGKIDGTAVDLSVVAGGTGGFVINGIDAGDQSGWSVSGAGDVNGDGLADVIVGALRADPNGERAGESYVVFGKADGVAVDLTSVAGGTGGFVINGADADDYAGFSVSGAGDVNGDGLADLLVGAPGFAYPTNPAGESYVIFGKVDGAAVDLVDVAAGTGGFVINGIGLGDDSGYSVSGAGDVNGDGLADLIVGAPDAVPGGGTFTGESYVVFGKADGAAVDLSGVVAGTGGFAISGIDLFDFSGASVSGAGDMNGDGLADLIVGAPHADLGGDSSAGESYVVFGKDDGAAVDLSVVAAGVGGFVINGINAGDRSGWSVSDAGDVNGDGRPDLIVGALHADPAGDSEAGESYVVFSPFGPGGPGPAGGDVSGDGTVNVTDLLDILGAWGPCGMPCPPLCAGDTNGDCSVDVADLLRVLACWSDGPGCP